jgi:hypothetical protein
MPVMLLVQSLLLGPDDGRLFRYLDPQKGLTLRLQAALCLDLASSAVVAIVTAPVSVGRQHHHEGQQARQQNLLHVFTTSLEL